MCVARLSDVAAAHDQQRSIELIHTSPVTTRIFSYRSGHHSTEGSCAPNVAPSPPPAATAAAAATAAVKTPTPFPFPSIFFFFSFFYFIFFFIFYSSLANQSILRRADGNSFAALRFVVTDADRLHVKRQRATTKNCTTTGGSLLQLHASI